MKKLLLAIALFVVSLTAPLASYAADQAAVLSAKDKKDLSRIEVYLNGLKNIAADFLQVDDAGGFMRGQISISRPGKMRVNYDPPSKDFIIADGSFVHIWNDDLKSQTNVLQSSSLAEFILRDPIKFSGEVTVTKIERFPAKLEVTLAQSDDPGVGSLTLVFQDKPLKLRQWKVVDAQGRLTGVTLEKVTEDIVFPSDKFVFTPPSFENNP
ncbi:MAG: outer membrane lipoprotein carrier protein LolA [Bdellovibrionales bacterium]